MIKCICLKCGKKGEQEIRIINDKNHLFIIHKTQECDLGIVKTTKEALSEMGFV